MLLLIKTTTSHISDMRDLLSVLGSSAAQYFLLFPDKSSLAIISGTCRLFAALGRYIRSQRENLETEILMCRNGVVVKIKGQVISYIPTIICIMEFTRVIRFEYVNAYYSRCVSENLIFRTLKQNTKIFKIILYNFNPKAWRKLFYTFHCFKITFPSLHTICNDNS